MSQRTFKRFYEAASVEPPAAGGGYRVLLDGRAIKTPKWAEMRLPTRAFAEAVAAEWAAQGEQVDPRAMPLTGFAWAAIDLVPANRARIVAEVAAYAEHDLVCYWAEGPAELVARQKVAWQPLVDWIALTFDAPLSVTLGVVSVIQPEASLAALRRAVAERSDLDLVALSAAASAAGSLVIALALSAGRINAAEAFAAGQIDETYQMERWGDDREAAKRQAAIRADLEAADRLFALLRA